MRIGIDAYPLVKSKAGISRYISNILEELFAIDKKNKYILYLPKEIKLSKVNVSQLITKGIFKKSAILWMQFGANNDFLRDKIDLFWGTQAFLPLRAPSKVKKIVTVYDLVWKCYPGTLNWDNKIIFPVFFKKSMQSADKIMTISRTTADDLTKYFPFCKNKTDIVYCGIKQCAGSGNQGNLGIFNKFNIGPKYILTVSTLEPRKNIINLIKAYSILKQKPGFDYQLVIAGAKGWSGDIISCIFKKVSFNKKDVIFTGYVDDVQLSQLYENSSLFAMVSVYEGFGMPVLEALLHGIPEIVSKIPVFKEVLGDNACFVDPLDYRSIAQGIEKIISDNSIKEKFLKNKEQILEKFSWKHSAKKVLDLIESFEK